MASTTRKSPYWRGVRDGMPYLIVIGPFALLFGVVATEAGFSVAQTMGFTVLVIAGAAQFTAVQLLSENAPVWVVLTASLGVNLRMAMYSASLTPHLGAAPLWQRALVAYLNVDQSFATASLTYEREPQMAVSDKVAYFLGVMSHMAPVWYLFTWIGAVAGAAIPPEFALDFALPITFLALVAPAVRTLAHLAAAVVAVLAALLAAGLPPGTGILLAGLLGMVTGAETERRMERRR
ncbi:MAG: AzlC family ABC transporter permease [Paracoccaceae bacterium]|nr:AzlC family ABC transporter permease [Paracoccaceae bacterium]